MYDAKIVGEYIRQAASKRGIDPDVAYAVARSEGLGEYVGDGGSSFGPFQLHYGGVAKGGNAVGGLGDIFTKRTGLDARNPDTWQAQVDFSLDEAKRGGWTPWHGWKGPAMAGINGKYDGQMPRGGGATVGTTIPAGLLGSNAVPDDTEMRDTVAELLRFTPTSAGPSAPRIELPEAETYAPAPMVDHLSPVPRPKPKKFTGLL